MTAMRISRQKFGLTLTELVVTVAVLAILLGLAVPAAKRLSESFQGGAGTHGLISAALSNARAIAVRHETYAGLWFHRDVDNKTYMVFMVHDDRTVPDGGTGRANGFRAVDGRKAVQLPDGVQAEAEIGGVQHFLFPIIFNSAGKLVIHPVRYRGYLPFRTPPVWYDWGDDLVSVNRFYILDTGQDGSVRTLMVNPYTGELVGQ